MRETEKSTEDTLKRILQNEAQHNLYESKCKNVTTLLSKCINLV